MKNLFALLAFVALLASCGDDEIVIVHTVSSISPTSGPFSTIVTINGSGFSTTPSENIVTVNGVQATVNSATENQIVIVIPELAGTGTVNVSISGGEVVGPVFDYVYLYTASTLAGEVGTSGFEQGSGSNARFRSPSGVDADGLGNIIIADNRSVRRMTTAGVVSLVAGDVTSGDVDGVGSAAKFQNTFSVKVHPDGTYYVNLEVGSSKLKKVTPAGVVTTWIGSAGEGYADGTADVAQLEFPEQMEFDANGNLYVCDWGNNCIRKISPAGVVSTLAGDPAIENETVDGTGSSARFDNPYGIVRDAVGNFFISEGDGDIIRKMTPAGVVTTFSGSGTEGSADGSAGSAQYNRPFGMCIGHDGRVYVADQNNNVIRAIDSDGSVETFAGNGTNGHQDGSALSAEFGRPWDICYDALSNAYYVADRDNFVIRKILVQ